MATFGDLRSMIADRDWSRWYQIDLARLKDAPLEAAQEYVRPHIMAALWGVPVVPRECSIKLHDHPDREDVPLRARHVYIWHETLGAGTDWMSNSRFSDETGRLIVEIMSICGAFERSYLRKSDRSNGMYEQGYDASSVGVVGEAAQAEAVLMRCAALLARGWPVTLEHAKSAIQPRPKLTSEVPHACFVAAEMTRSGGMRVKCATSACEACEAISARKAYDERWGVERVGFTPAQEGIWTPPTPEQRAEMERYLERAVYARRRAREGKS